MAERLIDVKLRSIKMYGSLRGAHDRMNRNGQRITLDRFYRIVEGYATPTPEERICLSQVLQAPVKTLFPEA